MQLQKANEDSAYKNSRPERLWFGASISKRTSRVIHNGKPSRIYAVPMYDMHLFGCCLI